MFCVSVIEILLSQLFMSKHIDLAVGRVMPYRNALIIIKIGFSSISRFSPEVLVADPGMGDVLQLLIVMICSQNYIRNPYLVAKLVEVIFVMQPVVQPKAGKINQAFLMHELALTFLTPSLMQFYVGVYSLDNYTIILLPNLKIPGMLFVIFYF